MVFDQLADGPHAAIAKVVDIIHRAVSIVKLQQITDHFEYVFFSQRPLLQRHIQSQPVI